MSVRSFQNTVCTRPVRTVIVEPAPAGAQASQTIVRIEPENPGVIYVPAYNPTVV